MFVYFLPESRGFHVLLCPRQSRLACRACVQHVCVLRQDAAAARHCLTCRASLFLGQHAADAEIDIAKCKAVASEPCRMRFLVLYLFAKRSLFFDSIFFGQTDSGSSS